MEGKPKVEEKQSKMDIKQIVESPVNRLIWSVVVLVLLIIIVWYHMKTENLTGQGLATGAAQYGATSGATMRRLAQGFTQPGQGDYNVVHVDEVKEVFGPKKKESLVDTAQAPNFMEIGNELYNYQLYNAPTQEPENLIAGSPVAKMEEAQLYGKLHPL
jgi:hypothetical protein